MPCNKEPPLSDEIQEQLSLLENSQELIRIILLGISLQYKALSLQKCQLLENAGYTQGGNTAAPLEPQSVQIAASLIVLYALFGFQRQAEDIACQTALSGGCVDWTEPKLNATVILVALMRLCRLTSSKAETDSAQNHAAGNAPKSAGLAEPAIE